MMHHVLEPEQVFAGRYRIERFLAEGGMGAVFVGEHIATEQRVAVKVLWPHVLASKSSIENFALEAKIAGRVVSDHIVRVIDAGFDETTRMPYLVMELLVGRTLESLVELHGPVAPALVHEYLRQVAAGLDKAHAHIDREGVARPIVHRDLKPANLFLTERDSGEPLVKILDFGIAKVVSEGTSVSQEVRGTPLFMAFEQASGGRITPQTDIWALGLIAFWLLTGKFYWRSAQPHSGSGMTQLFGEVLTLPLDSPTRRLAKLGGRAPWGSDFDVWFQTCVHRDAARRFPSAGGAVAALASSLGVLELAHTGRRIATRRVSTLLLAIEEPRSDLEAAVHTGAALARTRDAASRPGRGLSWAAGILLSSVTVAMAAFVILRRWPSPGPSTPAGMASLAATTALVPEPTNVFPSVSTPIPAAISSQDAPPTAAEFPPRLAVTQAAQLLSRAAPRARPAAQNRPAPVPSASASASPIPTSGRRTPDLYGER